MMRAEKKSRFLVGLAAGLLAITLFGLAVGPLEASLCGEALVECLFDPQPIYAWEIARLAFCGNGYYFCMKYVAPIFD
jgi:hypothetical protein